LLVAGESIRLHDLQLDYVRAQYPDKEALGLIHGAIRLSSNVICCAVVADAGSALRNLLSTSSNQFKNRGPEARGRLGFFRTKPGIREPMHPLRLERKRLC
jgi:hypothetical protein